MITVYFPDGTSKKVTAVEGQQLVVAGKASYTPYDITYDTAIESTPEIENLEPEAEIETPSYEATTDDTYDGPEKEAYTFGD